MSLNMHLKTVTMPYFQIKGVDIIEILTSLCYCLYCFFRIVSPLSTDCYSQLVKSKKSD